MAITALTDVVVPEIVLPEIALRINEKSAFMNSGAIVDDAVATMFASGNAGSLVNLPKYAHIPDAEPNISADTSSTATPQKMSQKSIFAIKHIRNQGWSSADLVSALSQPDPFLAVSNQIGDYWSKVYDLTCVNSVRGLWADNVLTDGGDMVFDISNDVAGTPSAGELISAEAIIGAMATLGDNMDDVKIIIMHSVTYANLYRQNMVEFIPNSQGVEPMPYYLGKRLVVSDYMPAITGTNRLSYLTALVSDGAFRYGKGAPNMPLEIFRDPAQGNGEGVETLWSRDHAIITPTNYSWSANAVISGVSPDYAEMQEADNWARTVDRKDVKIAFLISNG